MSKLKEATTQIKALEFLKSYYAKDCLVIYCAKEKRTKKESGGKRADGLLCFLKDDKPYTISLEAKSHKTLKALVSINNDEKFLLQSLIGSIILTLLTAFILINFTAVTWFYILITAVVESIVGVFIVAIVFDFLDLDSHRAISVINQLKQYPANEQWIAFSKHTDNLLLSSPFERKRNQLEVLEDLCRRNGFGLLLVNHKGCLIKESPKSKKGDFLCHYCHEKEILRVINTSKVEN
jgi:hypothetical protein